MNVSENLKATTVCPWESASFCSWYEGWVKSVTQETPLDRDVTEGDAEAFFRERQKSARLPPDLRPLDPRMLWKHYQENRPGNAKPEWAPMPTKHFPLLGHFTPLGVGESRLHALLQIRENLGDVVRFNAGALVMHLVSDPELVRQVLVERHRIYTKNTRGTRLLRLILGQGLLTAPRESWVKNRRLAQPTFHRRRIADYADFMLTASEELSLRWANGQTIDVHQAMMRLTLKIIAETMLSVNIDDEADEIGRAVSFVIEDVNKRLNAPVLLPLELPTTRNRRLIKAMTRLDDVVMRVIRERRHSRERKGDLLDLLMHAEDAETGERMNDIQLRDEVMTIFLAGHETTANALTWSLYLLAQNPAVGREVTEESQRVLMAPGEAAEKVQELELCERVINEAMRLYPPAWIMARRAEADDTLGGYLIPEGSIVLMSPWIVHRHPGHWKNPQGFDPTRFKTSASVNRPKMRFFPFGGGPRLCIGNNFALMEAKLILAVLMRDWRLETIPGDTVELDPVVTLRPKNGLHMRVRAH